MIYASAREDAVLLTSQGALEGRSGIEMFYTQALAMLPQLEFGIDSAIYAGDALLFQWTLISPSGRVNDGVDTFVFADGSMAPSGSRHRHSPANRSNRLILLQDDEDIGTLAICRGQQCA